MLEVTASTHRSEILLLQEVWSLKGNTNLRDYLRPLIKERNNQGGGGVAIFASKTVKIVPLQHYDIRDLEAVWAEVMIGKVRVVVGSV